MMCSVSVYVVCIQQACGYEFTNKLHRMFTDVNLSNDLNGKFAEYVKSHGTDLGLTFSIMVLQVTAAALLLCVGGRIQWNHGMDDGLTQVTVAVSRSL